MMLGITRRAAVLGAAVLGAAGITQADFVAMEDVLHVAVNIDYPAILEG